MPQKLRDNEVKALPAPAKGNKVYYDSEVKGFGVRVTAGGTRSFIFNYTILGRERRLTIGPFPAWSTPAARDKAKEYRRMVDEGDDPLQIRQDYIESPTVQELWDRYEAKHLPTLRPGSQRNQKTMFKKHILPTLGQMKVAEVRFQHVQDLHLKLGTDTPVNANRMLEMLRKAFNLAIQWEWIDRNPCFGISKYNEQPRQRFLNKTETGDLMALLDKQSNTNSANALKMLIYTGARKGEVLQATWQQFDLKEGTWTKPSAHTKQKREHRIPLSKEAVKLLKQLKAKSKGEFVFPGKGKDGHQTDLKKYWESIREGTSFADVRIHDLRHTTASLLISNTGSLAITGALLGHTQPQTTQRYAHLMDAPLRSATNKVGKIVNNTKQPKKNSTKK